MTPQVAATKPQHAESTTVDSLITHTYHRATLAGINFYFVLNHN